MEGYERETNASKNVTDEAIVNRVSVRSANSHAHALPYT